MKLRDYYTHVTITELIINPVTVDNSGGEYCIE